MTTTLTISDELAAALELRREAAGIPTLDAAAQALLEEVIASDLGTLGLPEADLRALIDAGEASGPVVAWDAATVRAEVRRRFQEGRRS